MEEHAAPAGEPGVTFLTFSSATAYADTVIAVILLRLHTYVFVFLPPTLFDSNRTVRSFQCSPVGLLPCRSSYNTVSFSPVSIPFSIPFVLS